MSEHAPQKVERYRPNVAIILMNEAGRILVCERIDEDGAWQFPQGGVDPGEDPLTALHREVREEIGLKPKHYQILECRDGYRYKYPPGVREKKKKKHNCVGQEQTYYLCQLTCHPKKVDIEQDPAEFQAMSWIEPKDFNLGWLPVFKRPIYTAVFADLLKSEASGTTQSPLELAQAG